jgi:acid phosphatase (class A)
MRHIEYFNPFKNKHLFEKSSYYINDVSNNLDEIVYGNAPIEFKEVMGDKNDPIKQWFEKEGLIKKIIEEAPLNSSETTKEDLAILIEKTSKATGDDLNFARYADDQNNLPNLFIDLLKSKGYSETMEEYFIVDVQTDVILNFLKDVINRPRPYQLAKAYNLSLYPLIRTDAMTAAYPSGHALTAFVMSDYYASKYPEISEDLKNLGIKIADSREITGIHYPSDTKISRIIADIIFQNNLIK